MNTTIRVQAITTPDRYGPRLRAGFEFNDVAPLEVEVTYAQLAEIQADNFLRVEIVSAEELAARAMTPAQRAAKELADLEAAAAALRAQLAADTATTK